MTHRLQIATVALGLLLVSHPAQALLVFEETFDGSAGFSTSSSFHSDGSNDYVGITGINDFGSGSAPSGIPGFTGFDVNFLVGEDLDGNSTPDFITLTWTGIDISGKAGLEFSGLFAAATNVWDEADDRLDVSYQIDSNGFQELFSLHHDVSDTDAFNSDLSVDTDNDGLGDGIALGLAATTLTAAIAETGDSLDLQITVSADSGSESFAIDTLRITAVPEPTAALFGSLLAGALGMSVSRRPADRD